MKRVVGMALFLMASQSAGWAMGKAAPPNTWSCTASAGESGRVCSGIGSGGGVGGSEAGFPSSDSGSGCNDVEDLYSSGPHGQKRDAQSAALSRCRREARRPGACAIKRCWYQD
jgi:hypothetical protein